MMKYVLDTNVLISNPYSIYSFAEENTEIIITSATLSELDHLKSKSEISREVRIAIRLLSQIVLNKTYEEISIKGISLQEHNKALPASVVLKIIDYKGDEKFELNQQDAKIIAITKQEGAVLITRDVNMLIIALSSGCEAKQFTGDDVIKDSDVLYTGYAQVQSDFWNTVGHEVEVQYVNKGKTAVISVSEFPEDIEFYPNMYLYESTDGDETLIGQVEQVYDNKVYLKVLKHSSLMKFCAWNEIVPRDIYQAMAFNAMMDDNNDVVSLVGSAGSGKSLLAIATALELINQNKYANMIYVKADAGVGVQAHGFLPGTIDEKLSQTNLAGMDSLMRLHKDDAAGAEKSVQYLIDKKIVQFPSMYYFRGRTLGHADPGKGSVVIIDEAQNLTVQEIISIISRIGENSKLVLCGNTKQIDNRHVNAINNGLVYAIQKFREYEHASNVILHTVYRSRLAAFVEDNF